MKKHIYILTVILLSVCTSGHLYAQQNVESDIKAIRDLYSKAQEFIKHDKEDPTIEYQVTLSLKRHHTVEGHVTYDYHFYFRWDGQDGYSGSPVLKFVRVKITDRAGSSQEEYLFNDKEDLVFYFTKFKEGGVGNDMEIRLYYKNGERIRELIKQTDKITKKVTERNSINVLYATEVEHPLSTVKIVKSLFRAAMSHTNPNDSEHEGPIRNIDGAW